MKMRAIQVARAGGAFELVQRERPQPRFGDVRVKVEACGVCHSDSIAKEGLFPSVPFPSFRDTKSPGSSRRSPTVSRVGPSGPGSASAGSVDIAAGTNPVGFPHRGNRARGRQGAARSRVTPSGTSIDSEDTLNFSVLSGVRPTIETMPLERAAEAYEKMMQAKARFRMVLPMN
jgi:hypothetical protein